MPFSFEKWKPEKFSFLRNADFFSPPPPEICGKRGSKDFSSFPANLCGLAHYPYRLPSDVGMGAGQSRKKVYFFSAVAAVLAQKSGCLSFFLPLSFIWGALPPPWPKSKDSGCTFLSHLFSFLFFQGKWRPFRCRKKRIFFLGFADPFLLLLLPLWEHMMKKVPLSPPFPPLFSSTTFFLLTWIWGKGGEVEGFFGVCWGGHGRRRERVENLPSPSFPFFPPLWLIRKEKLHEGVRRNKNIIFFVEWRLCTLFLGMWQDKQHEHFHPKTAMLLGSNRGSNSRLSSSSSTYVYFPRD